MRRKLWAVYQYTYTNCKICVLTVKFVHSCKRTGLKDTVEAHSAILTLFILRLISLFVFFCCKGE